jgi:hypothetical protein
METWMTQGLTVGALRAKLAQLPEGPLLVADGCDCLGPGARLWVSPDGTQVCLRRPAGDGPPETNFAGWREL